MKLKTKTYSKTNNLILWKYFSALLGKNVMIWIMMVINILLIIMLQIIPAFNSGQNYYYAYKTNAIIYWGVPNLILIIFTALCVINLFVITKRNNVDLYLYSKSFKNKSIVWYKQLTIMFFSLHIILGMSVGLIIQIAFKVPMNVVWIGFVGQIGSLLLMALIWVFIFSFIAIFCKFFIAIFNITFVSVGFILGAIIPIIAQQSYQIDSNFNALENKNNIIKIYHFDKQSNAFDQTPKYALYYNPLAKNNNNIQGWKPDGWVRSSPFNVIFGFNSLVGANVFVKDNQIENLIDFNAHYAFNNIEINTNQLHWNNQDSSEYITVGLNEKTIFDYPNTSILFDEINQELMTNNFITNHVNDVSYWSTLQNELKTRADWNNNLSDEETIMLLHMMGLDSSTSILYNIFNKYQIIKTQLNSLQEYFTNRYNQTFSDFLMYIWSSHQVKINVFAYKSLGDYNNFSQYRPQLKTFDPLKRADQYDLAFVKNRLFNVVMNNKAISTIQMLNRHLTYEDIPDYKTIFPNGTNGASVIDKTTFDNYLDDHATVNNLQALLRNASAKIDGNAYGMQFRNNVNNNLIVNKEVSINQSATMQWTWLYLIGAVIIIIAMKFGINWKMAKGDLI